MSLKCLLARSISCIPRFPFLPASLFHSHEKSSIIAQVGEWDATDEDFSCNKIILRGKLVHRHKYHDRNKSLVKIYTRVAVKYTVRYSPTEEFKLKTSYYNVGFPSRDKEIDLNKVVPSTLLGKDVTIHAKLCSYSHLSNLLQIEGESICESDELPL